MIRCTHQSWNNTRNKDKVKLPKGLLKATISDEKLEMEEDERRLFYVALTRAKHQVHLSYAKARSEQSKKKEDLPSLFLSEIPTNLVTQFDTTAEENQSLTALETIFSTPTATDLAIHDQPFIRQLAENHIISPTSLNNYLTCPRKFFYQNLIRIPQGANKSSAMGSAIHASLDNYFRQYHRTRIKPPRELLTLQYKRFLERELLTEKDFQERLEIGQNMLNQYYDEQQETFSPETITEYNFARDGVTLDGIRISGKIDKILPNPADTSRLTISDFKTGNPDSGMTKSRPGGDYFRQIIFYKILCDNSPQFTRKFNGQMTTGCLEFLEKSKSKKTYINASVDLTSEAIAEVSDNIRFAHAQILALNFEKIEKSDPCERCPFANICWK